MNYGKAIKTFRLQLDQTQEDFAFNTGISQGTLSNIENGVRGCKTDVLDKISEYTKIPVPIILWSSLTVNDVPENKKEAFILIKHSIDELIKSI